MHVAINLYADSLYVCTCTVVYISLECDSDELDEDIGQVEVCAMLNQGELARNVTVEINTECIDACSKSLYIM